MEPTKENDASVLASSQEDAIPMVANKNTPVAKKTRRATRMRMDSTVVESPTNPEPPKAPTTPSSRTLDAETPRRSCRKSVRPRIDYEDIVRSAKKLIPEAVDVQEEGQEPDPVVHKWNVVEVGKNSRKRSRKSKRLTSKKVKTEQDEEPQATETPGEVKSAEVLVEQPDVKEVQPEDKEVLPAVQAESQKPQQAEAVVEQSEIKAISRKSTRETKKPDTPIAVALKKKNSTKYKHIVGEEDINELGLVPLDDASFEEDKGERALKDEQLVPSTEKPETLAKSANEAEQIVEDEEMPLQPLDKSLHEDEEMASLIMLDEDDEGEKPPLDTTFDADDIKEENQSVILVDSPEVRPVGDGNNPSIKVVLTTTDDKNETLLNLEHASPKGYRFPTPFILKKSFKFSDPPAPSGSGHAQLEPEPRYGRRRSKSACQLDNIMSRTVTFRNSPVEIVSVVDIDKRLKGGVMLNNVTNRRKRSMSLDEKICFTSRIPKPKFQLLAKPKPPVTPSHVKRTKLPDFTALHEKQFAKMESLVDHMERKAERAKILTTSALKKPPGSTAKQQQAQCPTFGAGGAQGARPKALKKIDMTADRTVVVDIPEKKLPPTRMPLKSAPNVTAAPRPAFNLSTAVKTFNATISSKPAESRKDKLAERHQRHMDMFKGKAATKAQAKKTDFIRGVRLNRRFELQMQHRKHLEED